MESYRSASARSALSTSTLNQLIATIRRVSGGAADIGSEPFAMVLVDCRRSEISRRTHQHIVDQHQLIERLYSGILSRGEACGTIR